MTLIFMFVPPRTTRNCMCWFKNGPLIVYCCVYLNFLIIPILSILWWFAMWKTTVGLCVGECPGSDFSAWFLTYALMCVLMAGPQLFLIKMLLEAIKYQFDCEDEDEITRI